MSAVPCLVQERSVGLFLEDLSLTQLPCPDLRSSPSNLKITFVQPEKAVAPGQVAVIWEHDWCLGCGTIEETFP